MLLSLAAVAAGAALLAYAADQFVLGAARVALLRRLSPLVVGVVIVGFGTSSPELLVSLLAALGDDPAVAVGNILGSNLANLTLLLGVGAAMVPIAVSSRTVLREAPLVVAASVVFAIVVQRGLSAAEGLLLLAAMATVVTLVLRSDDPQDPLGSDAQELAAPAEHRIRAEVVRTAAGLVGTVTGAQALLWGALDLADRAGLGAGFVGATLVAVGTSLPELVTVIQSARRRETDLIVGNLLGSNLFNALAVGGVVGLVRTSPLDAPALTGTAAVAATLAAVAALVAMRTGHVVTRREGLVLVVAYAATVPLLA